VDGSGVHEEAGACFATPGNSHTALLTQGLECVAAAMMIGCSVCSCVRLLAVLPADAAALSFQGEKSSTLFTVHKARLCAVVRHGAGCL
jgi:hypothetical protein